MGHLATPGITTIEQSEVKMRLRDYYALQGKSVWHSRGFVTQSK